MSILGEDARFAARECMDVSECVSLSFRGQRQFGHLLPFFLGAAVFAIVVIL